MRRREFLSTAAAVGAALALPSRVRAAAAEEKPDPQRRFSLRYAPHFGMFRHSAGDDPVAQIDFLADQGFTALEDNGMRGRARDEQDRIAAAMTRRNVAMGVFVASANFSKVDFASSDQAAREQILKDMRDSIETAKRVSAKWCTIVPGRFDLSTEVGYQTVNVIDNLKRCAELCEPVGLVMVLEPLNPRDHPGLFLTKIAQAFAICRAVSSPSCKILFDIYHQQITEGNLIPNFEQAWDEVAYIQIGDNPGRCEPTTGEINYRNIFAFLRRRGFAGILGMEHGNSRPGREGEQALIDAYVQSDSEP
jgi:hydroxypyruvate isomerase